MQSAEIIAIGSELLTPFKTDSNSLWLTEKLNEIGIEVKLKTVVGDDELRLEETIRDAINRSDIVLTTGGLGPTEDDITRPVSARAINRKLVFKEELEDELRMKFQAFGREMPERNLQQAFVIEGAEVLPNPRGSAVGMSVKIGDKILVILPGPPREMKPMFQEFVLPKLADSAGETYVLRKTIKVSGMGESALDELIAPIYTEYKNPETAILFNKSEIEVQLTARSDTREGARQLLDDLAGKIAEKLGTSVFSLKGEKMEEVVGDILAKRGETVSVAESCTGGLIGKRLTEVSGSSVYFIEGAVTYSNEAKRRTLNVSKETLERYGAVSEEVAMAMASGMRERTGTDYAISVTGIAGPTGGSSDKPVGTVFIGYADDNETSARKFHLPGDRYLVRWRSSQAALDYLRRKVLKKDEQ